MDGVNAHVGLDVHKDTIAVAIADNSDRGEVRFRGNIRNSPEHLRRTVTRNGTPKPTRRS